MNVIQRVVTLALFPFARWIEHDSRGWRMDCPCGHSTNVWATGGIRWLAAGSPKQMASCRRCGSMTIHADSPQPDRPT